jgi:hypothetical protein
MYAICTNINKWVGLKDATIVWDQVVFVGW